MPCPSPFLLPPFLPPTHPLVPSPLVFLSHRLSSHFANLTVLQLFTLQLQFSDLQRSNADFSHYMWFAEKKIDSLTGANALLKNQLASLASDVSQLLVEEGGDTPVLLDV